MTTETLATRTDDELIAMHRAADAATRDAIAREMARRAIGRAEAGNPRARAYAAAERAHRNPAHDPAIDLALALVLISAVAG